MENLELLLLLGRECKPRNPETDYVECPECHNNYDPLILVNEPFREITDDNGRNRKKVCEDCYWKWIGSDDDMALARFGGSLEETDEGLCYVKDL